MGVFYTLVNHTKREEISFQRMGTDKLQEIAGNPASASATTWYLLQNLGDEIEFVPLDYGPPIPPDYQDVTDRIVNELVDAGLLRDDGIRWRDEIDPSLFIRALTNVYMDGVEPGDRAPPR